MKEDYVRKTLLEQHIKWSGEYSTYLEKAKATEDMEEKDVAYRHAAVLGMRLDSISKATAVLNGKLEFNGGWVRAFQKHMRDMAKLKYRDRPAHMQYDQLDVEVMSQFFQSDDPEQNRLYQELMSGKKMRSNDAGSSIQASAETVRGASAYSAGFTGLTSRLQ